MLLQVPAEAEPQGDEQDHRWRCAVIEQDACPKKNVKPHGGIPYLLLALLLAGCTGARASQTTSLELGSRQKEEARELSTWSSWGSQIGHAMRLYCLRGSKAERHAMMAALEAEAAPADVHIECPNGK